MWLVRSEWTDVTPAAPSRSDDADSRALGCGTGSTVKSFRLPERQLKALVPFSLLFVRTVHWFCLSHLKDEDMTEAASSPEHYRQWKSPFEHQDRLPLRYLWWPCLLSCCCSLSLSFQTTHIYSLLAFDSSVTALINANINSGLCHGDSLLCVWCAHRINNVRFHFMLSAASSCFLQMASGSPSPSSTSHSNWVHFPP